MTNTKMKNLKINEDWERESLKDLVYLQETQHLLEEEVRLAMKQPKHKILNRDHEHQDNPLPF
jgi:hypothetical protein